MPDVPGADVSVTRKRCARRGLGSCARSNGHALSMKGRLLCTHRGQRVSGSIVSTRPLCTRLFAVHSPRPRAQAAPPFLSLAARGQRPCGKTGRGRSPDRAALRKPFLRPSSSPGISQHPA